MSLPRHHLPPLHCLSAFEAAARLGSFSAAARELAPTRSAVSKQVAALDARLEAELCTRVRPFDFREEPFDAATTVCWPPPEQSLRHD